MKKKLNSLKDYYKVHPKRFWVLGGIAVIILLYVIFHKAPSTITVVPVTKGDLKSTVLATGQVTSATDLGLSFSASGIVSTLPVSVGDKVYAGQVLATLDNGTEYAALKSAQANYQKVVDGSSSQEVAVAQASLASAQSNLLNTQKLQDTLLANAYRQLLNADLTPTLALGQATTPPTVTGSYNGTQEGSYTITLHVAGSGSYFGYSGLDSGTGAISTTSPVAIGGSGLYIQFPANYAQGQDVSWTILLPNTKSPNYLTYSNAYQSALTTHDSAIAAAQASVTQAEANLDLKKAAARPADLDIANAQVLLAKAAFEKTIIVAPASGTVVHVDTKIGERADAAKEVIVIQDVGNLYVEANINETNIARVALGQPVAMTLDAFGPDTIFGGKVVHIDPSSTTADGVVNFKIKTSIEAPKCADTAICTNLQNGVRPGMNANLVITAWDKPDVVAIPKAAITTATNGTSTVRVVLDDKDDKFETRTITLGALGDGNLVEITSGLTAGEKIASGVK